MSRHVSSPPAAADDSCGYVWICETVGAAPAVTTGRIVRAPASVEFAVGARLPATVPLYALPDTLGLQLPAVRAYRYAVVDDRVFLVDPASSLVVEELEP
jgi:Protein of unknown function (DUF1236)